MCSVEFQTTLVNPTKDTPGQCWHAIFRNPVIVEGYPIPRRKRYGSGLETHLNVMAGLTSCPRINKYKGHHYLKGYSTALVPTEKIDNMVLWHLYYSDDGSRLPYPNPAGLHCADLRMQDLTAARHVVGWCSNAKFMTGKLFMNSCPVRFTDIYQVRPIWTMTSDLPSSGGRGKSLLLKRFHSLLVNSLLEVANSQLVEKTNMCEQPKVPIPTSSSGWTRNMLLCGMSMMNVGGW